MSDFDIDLVMGPRRAARADRGLFEPARVLDVVRHRSVIRRKLRM